MTFAELQKGVFDDMQYQAQPKPGVQDRVRRYLNEGLERVMRRPRLKTLRFATFPFTSRPGEGFYGAPMVFERIDYIIDLTNGRRLRFRSRDWYRNLDPSVLTSGTPSVWIPEGIGPMMRKPRAQPDGYVRIYAIAAYHGDVTQQVTMRATNNYGNQVINLYGILNGMNPVLIGYELPPETQISQITLSSSAYDVHFHDITTPASVYYDNVAMINSGELSTRHVGFRLYPTPSVATNYEIEGQRVIPRMRMDEDTPPFPDNFHEMLACYARARFYRKDGRLNQAREEMAEFERFANDLTVTTEFPLNYRPVAGKHSAEGTRWSDLGPNYPADRLGLISD